MFFLAERLLRRAKHQATDGWCWFLQASRHSWAKASLPYQRWRLQVADRKRLLRFTAAGSTLLIPVVREPRVSVLITSCRDPAALLATVESLLQADLSDLEILIVTESTTEIESLLAHLSGLSLVENSPGTATGEARNLAAERARGAYFLFLEAGCRLTDGLAGGALESMVQGNIAAVGSKSLLPNGLLESAGYLVSEEGVVPYGRFEHPLAPPYMCRRDVDAFAPTFLLTRRDVFLSLGGLSTSGPAAFDHLSLVVDYCRRLRRAGLRTVYDPRLVTLSPQDPLRQPREVHDDSRTRPTGRRRSLAFTRSSSPERAQLPGSPVTAPGERILFIDNRIPHQNLGHGLPRAHKILLAMAGMGHFVTFYPLVGPGESWSEAYGDIPIDVEIMLGAGQPGLRRFLSGRRGFYTAIFVSRLHNLRFLKAVQIKRSANRRGPRIIYDAESLGATREWHRLRAEGQPVDAEGLEQLLRREVSETAWCDAITAVSFREKRLFESHGATNVWVLGHAIKASPGSRPFSQRRGFLFVGSLDFEGSSNLDGLRWFTREALPLIRQSADFGDPDATLTVVGALGGRNTTEIDAPGISFAGSVPVLGDFYNAARVFVAPIRYGAGIPLKVIEAAAHGIPTVTTQLVADLLGWTPDAEILVGDTPHELAAQCLRIHSDGDLWQRLRSNALRRIEADYAPERFAATLREVLSGTCGDPQREAEARSFY